MALQPYSFNGKETLQPGARGEMFVNNGIPGHRNDGERINRTNTTLNLNHHDVPNIKYALDPRLPRVFRYGWAYGYNQIVIPKGRLVAVDPHLVVMDTDTQHFHNAITIANGGKDVDYNHDKAKWEAAKAPFALDVTTGKDTTAPNTRRPANIPIGILERNEYTRDMDAYNGIMPGPVRTDAMAELPWFASQEKAEGNPWGSAYGDLKPGDLIKSDENGRFVVSPLSRMDADGKFPGAAEAATLVQIEKERQQVVGTIYGTDKSLLPEGAARFAQWALEDRKNFNDFNPYVWPNSNRAGEDVISNPPTAYQSDYTYPGYPYDKNYMSSDLHMLASSRNGMYDPRFDLAHRLDQGVPGLLDGYNAVVNTYGEKDGKPIITLNHIVENSELTGHEFVMKLPDVNLESAKIAIGDETAVTLVKGATIGKFEVSYADLHKGLFALVQKQAGTKEEKAVKISYVKRGMAGVPTNLDWDGCQGTVKILLNK